MDVARHWKKKNLGRRKVLFTSWQHSLLAFPSSLRTSNEPDWLPLADDMFGMLIHAWWFACTHARNTQYAICHTIRKNHATSATRSQSGKEQRHEEGGAVGDDANRNQRRWVMGRSGERRRWLARAHHNVNFIHFGCRTVCPWRFPWTSEPLFCGKEFTGL